ncbi:MAG: hypothetical protein CSA75_00120, partial [Sorangium cellulosum]
MIALAMREPSTNTQERRGLDHRSLLIVRALCEALLCDEDDQGHMVPPRCAWVDRVTGQFDLLVGAGSLTTRNGIKALAWLMNRLPLLALGTRTRMTELTLAERIDFLEALENSRVGLLATTVVVFKIPLS